MKMLPVTTEERVFRLVSTSITVNVLHIGSVNTVNVRKKILPPNFLTLIANVQNDEVGYVTWQIRNYLKCNVEVKPFL